MKTKTTLLAGVAALAAVASANATLVAGWDFSQYFASGFNSINGGDFAGEGNAQANYSDLLSPSPDAAAGVFGSIYFDGSNGSFDGANGFASTISPFTGNLASGSIQTADLNPFNNAGSYALLQASGQTFTNDLSLQTTVDGAIVFSADVSSLGQAGTVWQLNFAGLDAGGSSVSWEVSTDGTNYISLGAGADITLSGVDTLYTVNAGAAYDNEDQIFFRGTFSGVTSQALIDNVGISATVVPEPSTYAAIFGAIALAFAAARRRA